MEKSNDEIVLDLLKFYRDNLMSEPINANRPTTLAFRIYLSQFLGRNGLLDADCNCVQDWEAAYPWEEKIKELTKTLNKAIL